MTNKTLSGFGPALILTGPTGSSHLQPLRLYPASKCPQTDVSSAALSQPPSGRGCSDMTSVVCRVQYLDDSDPFVCTNFPEPRRPPAVPLEESVPLSEQVPGIHKLLEAPLKVGAGTPGSPGPGLIYEINYTYTCSIINT